MQSDHGHRQNHISFALCPADDPTDCEATYHLPCLAAHFLAAELPSIPRPLLPKTGTCPSCACPLEWGAVIRGCYARREGVLEGVLDVEKEAQRVQRREEAAARRRERLAEGKRGRTGQAVDEESDEVLEEEGDDEDDEMMRSMVRDGDGSEGASGSDESPLASPPKTKKPAAAKPRGKPAMARRGRGAGRATTGRRKKQAESVPEGGSGSESEGTRLERKMMAIHDSE